MIITDLYYEKSTTDILHRAKQFVIFYLFLLIGGSRLVAVKRSRY